jgi:hypothetical protein
VAVVSWRSRNCSLLHVDQKLLAANKELHIFYLKHVGDRITEEKVKRGARFQSKFFTCLREWFWTWIFGNLALRDRVLGNYVHNFLPRITDAKKKPLITAQKSEPCPNKCQHFMVAYGQICRSLSWKELYTHSSHTHTIGPFTFSFFQPFSKLKYKQKSRLKTIVQQRAYSMPCSSRLKISNLHHYQCLHPYSSHSTVQTWRCPYCNNPLVFEKECLNI